MGQRKTYYIYGICTEVPQQVHNYMLYLYIHIYYYCFIFRQENNDDNDKGFCIVRFVNRVCFRIGTTRLTHFQSIIMSFVCQDCN